MRKRTSAFTLLEVLVTLALIAAVFAVATTKYHRLFAATRIQADARGLGDHFVYAVSRAYTSGSYHTLEFDLSSGRYWLKLGRQDEDAQMILKRRLGRTIRFTDIQVGHDTYEPPGVLSIEVSPLGVTSDVLINLEDQEGATRAVFLGALAQRIEHYDGYRSYEELQEEPPL